MRAVCAWCRAEGKPGYMGEREPLDDSEATHGVCEHHKTQLLASLPSRSFPDTELLIVVNAENTVLYEYLKRWLAAVPGVEVILDRRLMDRRELSGREPYERRHRGRRRIRVGTTSASGEFTIVRFTPKTASLAPF